MHNREVTGSWEYLPSTDFSFRLCVLLALKFLNHHDQIESKLMKLTPL